LEADFLAIHNGFYSYDKAIYVNAITKMVITCKLHGDFEQSSNVHLRGDGCPTCGHLKTVSGSVQRAKEKFPIEAKEIHNNKYDYSLVDYKNARTNVEIICSVHGTFKQTPDNHLKGKGCKKCSTLINSNNQRFSREEFIDSCNSTHNSYYSYDNLDYTRMSDKIIVICPAHGDFSIRAQHHINGVGCSSCASHGFDKSKSAVLYYLKIHKGRAYKIGITNRSVQDRFLKKDFNHIEVLKTWHYENGEKAYHKEQDILKEFKFSKYQGIELLSSGNTELFNWDVLGLDNQ